jgi:hypothetical protein
MRAIRTADLLGKETFAAASPLKVDAFEVCGAASEGVGWRGGNAP